jgi:hypothetical protein
MSILTKTIKIDIKEEDYFGSVTFIDGKLDQFIIQRYTHKEYVHSDEEILKAVAEIIAAETKSVKVKTVT